MTKSQHEKDEALDFHISEFTPSAQAQIESAAQRLIFMDEVDRSIAFENAYDVAYMSARNMDDFCSVPAAHGYAMAVCRALQRRLDELLNTTRVH